MAAEARAADLPEGSIVASRIKVWIKTFPSDYSDWRATTGAYEHNRYVDEALASGATVLRHGYGD